MPHANTFLLELFAIFVWAKVFGELFEQFKLPAVLGEILAGVILGPFATQLVVPSETTHSIAELGAIFLLFTVGLETPPNELLRVGKQAMNVAIAGVAVPFLLGFGYMILRGNAGPESTFVGAAMVATSVGITARVLGDLHVLKTRAAQIILGAAVFDDILGMLILAIVVGLVATGPFQWIQLSVTMILAVGFTLFMIFVAPRLIGRVRPGVQRLSTHNAPLILSLAICLGLSVAAEKIGMAAIIGAFFAGLAFAEYSPEWNLQPRVHALTEFLAPFFFFSMGARLNVGIFSGEVLVDSLVIAVLAVLSKVVGCGLPVLREGWDTAAKVGVGMMPRGEVGLIVALVGLQMNMVTQSAYAIVIFMTAVTTLLAPPILRILFRERRAEEVAQV
jgi:Kef-type K+ transport system membrane component KefB